MYMSEEQSDCHDCTATANLEILKVTVVLISIDQI